jgi:hypothetical protein
MSNKSKITLVATLIVGTASAGLATDAFAANNYDSPDWAPMYAGPTVSSEPRTSAYERNAERAAPGPRSQLSHRIGTDRPR